MIIGLAEMNARLLNLIKALPDEIDRALQDQAHVILQVAKERCPVDTGALRDSGKLEDTVKSGHEIAVPITFGDPEPYYAIYVHEDLEAKHPNGGQAKFLESAINDYAPGMSVRVGESIKFERLVV
jgi:Bacteriophage HK97-gp10, putative tail-component